MKKRNLLLLLIPILLISIFSFNLFAEEDPESDLGIAEPLPIPSLDSYFYTNYDLLPYIESDGTQYINLNINASDIYTIKCQFSNPEILNHGANYIFGTYGNASVNDGTPETRLFGLAYSISDGVYKTFIYDASGYTTAFAFDPYSIHSYTFDQGSVRFDNNLVATNSNSFLFANPIYLFGRNINDGISNQSVTRLYNLSIYDNSLSDPNDNESDPIGYIRYYYPARAKSGGTIGLYDAVSKTFISSSNASSFDNPVGSATELSLSAGITSTLLAGLGWIGQILAFAKSNSVILIFIAIGLAGVAFRWARRVVHF